MLNDTVKYALACLRILSGATSALPMRAVDIAEAAGTPIPYTANVLKHLAEPHVRILCAKRGRNGGYWISDLNVTVGRVLEELGIKSMDNMDLGNRFNSWYVRLACLRAELDGMTLADLGSPTVPELTEA